MSQEARTALPILVPAISIALAVLIAALRPWRKTPQSPRADWAAPLAIGLGFLAAFVVLTGAAIIHPKDRWHWIGPIAVVATSFGLTISVWGAAFRWRAAIAVIGSAVIALLLHPPPVAGQPLLWKFAVAGLTFVLWIAVDPVAQRRIQSQRGAGVDLPLAMVLVFAGLSIVLLQCGQAGFSLLAAAASAACGSAALIALLSSGFAMAGGGTFVVASLLAALATIGWQYNMTAVPIWPFILILVSPLMLWVGQAKGLRSRRWLSTSIGVAAVALAVAAAVIWAINTGTSDDEEYSLQMNDAAPRLLALLDGPALF